MSADTPSSGSTSSGSIWRDTRNARSRARLDRALPAIFPAPVLRHALSRPLVPPTPRLAVESYWRAHILRADRLARALAARSGAPEGWTWRIGTEPGLAASFRLPPSPWREPAHARGRGHCCLCGQPVFRFGWHRDLWGTGQPNKNAAWHSACVAAWKLWCAPAEQVTVLKRHQRHRCTESGKRLFKTAEVDHRVPLYRVWREHRDAPWPELLAYWGAPNLQVVNRVVHVAKCGAEAGERAARRRADAEPGLSVDALGETDVAKVDAQVIQPQDDETRPERTDAMTARADPPVGGSPVRRGRPPRAPALARLRPAPEG